MRKVTGAAALLLVLPLMALLSVAGCEGGSAPPADKHGSLEVVATIFPLADMAAQLGGEKVAVTCLLPAGASPHTYEPTAGEAAKISQAHLLLYIGAGLDDWAVKAADPSGGPNTLGLAGAALERGWRPPGEGSAGQGAGEPLNPHLWLDPLAARDYLCPAIAEALIKADRQNEAFYRASLNAYQQELTALDEEIRTALAGPGERSFISLHAAWSYFAQRYELDEAAVISEFPGQEPSAAWISELIDLCREKGVRVVAAEPQLSAAVADTIAREIQGSVVLLDPLGGAGLPQRESYLELMRCNTAALVEVLR